MPRITKIYTRGGDEGLTSLGGGQRIPKDDLRIETYGTVDELNSVIGVALALGLCDTLSAELPIIQNELFHLGSDLCFLEADKERFNIPQIALRHVENLEALIDRYTAIVGPLENFILPAGTPGAAQLHVARTVCRRAERLATALARSEGVGEFVIQYLNRLSDALFVMARLENHERGVAETTWNSRV
jgi:cob(I)alamin adenosyltransferase